MKNSILKEKLKNALRPYILNEITMEPQKAVAKYQEPCELLEKIKKEVGDDAKVEFSPDSGKVVVECEINDNKYSLQISENGCDCYSVIAILDGSERASLKTAKFDDIQKLIKETIKNKERKKYTEKAYDKNAIPKKDDKKEKVEETDKCEEVKEVKKQIDHKPVETKDRDIEEIVKGTAGMKDSTKFEKQVDIKGKDKVKLKADKKNNSKEKLTQKVDGTSKMKSLKESIKNLFKEVLMENVNEQKNYNQINAAVINLLSDKYKGENLEDVKNVCYLAWLLLTDDGKEYANTEYNTGTLRIKWSQFDKILNKVMNEKGSVDVFTREFGIREAIKKYILDKSKKLKENLKPVIKKIIYEDYDLDFEDESEKNAQLNKYTNFYFVDNGKLLKKFENQEPQTYQEFLKKFKSKYEVVSGYDNVVGGKEAYIYDLSMGGKNISLKLVTTVKDPIQSLNETIKKQ